MRILLLACVVQTALALSSFGTSYLGRSRLCKSWSCINSHLGLQDELPPKDLFVEILRGLLPDNSWQDVVVYVAEVCYNERRRRYTNTCPGQALLYCVVDNLIEKCPEEFVNKDDGCAPPTSLAGFKIMFTQSRYEDFAKNLPFDRRPAWFLKNYFNSKCCNLPPIFNNTLLSSCGFSTLMHYNVHQTQYAVETVVSVENYKYFHVRNTTKKFEKETKEVITERSLPELDVAKISDPLDCCDLDGFLPRSSRLDCDFKTSWQGVDRLSITPEAVVTTTPVSTTTQRSEGSNDVKVVPVSCESTSCVFRKLQVIDASGSVNIEAFTKILDNMTDVHPEWRKAKARVVTKCLNRRVTEYEADCEINRVLACTFDILSENCPFVKDKDHCRHSHMLDDTMMCQVSSSKFRPKYRRQFCGIPSLVSHKLLSQCDISSLSDMVYVPTAGMPEKNKRYWHVYRNSCKDLTQSTKCLLNSTGVLNKYGFMDYFKMKDRIRSYTTKNNSWSPFTDIHLNAFMTFPRYGSYCNSPKKLLNVLDTMLMTCPISKRRDSEYCRKIFDDLATLPPKKDKNTNFKPIETSTLDSHQTFYSNTNAINNITNSNASVNLNSIVDTDTRKNNNEKKVQTTTEFNFWAPNSNNMPTKTYTITPQKFEDSKAPLTVLPVYRRYPYTNEGLNEYNATFRPISIEATNPPAFEYQDNENNRSMKPGLSNEDYIPAGRFEYPQMP